MNISGEGTVQITDAKGSITEYEPLIMHFKSPSEHCFDFERWDLELQIFLRKPGEQEISAAIAVFWDRSMISDEVKDCPFI